MGHGRQSRGWWLWHTSSRSGGSGIGKRKRPRKYKGKKGNAQPTPEQRVDAALRKDAAELWHIARAEYQWAATVALMEGEHDGYRRPKRNEFDHWELAELTRLNCRGDDLLLRLPDAAYEARRLGRYTEGSR